MSRKTCKIKKVNSPKKREILNEKQPSKHMDKMKRESQKKKYKPLKEELIKMRHLCPIRSTKFKKKVNGGYGEKGVLSYYLGRSINWYTSGST